jgi:DNA gyrase subunit B
MCGRTVRGNALTDIEAVQKRPGMYVGPTNDGTGLHNLVFEVAANAIKEGLAGYCSQINVTLEPDGSVTVADDGRGLAVDRDTRSGLPKAQAIVTRLAGLSWDPAFLDAPESLQGVGLYVVNALSTWFNVRIWRDGQAYSMGFADGAMITPLTVTGGSDDRRGTEIAFLRSDRVFTNVGLGFATLDHRFRLLGSLGAEVTLTLLDRRAGREQESVFRL